MRKNTTIGSTEGRKKPVETASSFYILNVWGIFCC
jgi:hypothetical protein